MRRGWPWRLEAGDSKLSFLVIEEWLLKDVGVSTLHWVSAETFVRLCENPAVGLFFRGRDEVENDAFETFTDFPLEQVK